MSYTQAFELINNGDASSAFRLNSVSLSSPATDEIQIEVEAFGLNYADVMARRGLYRECPPLPTVIGYEVVGKVIKSGSQENEHLIGERVVAFTRFGGYSQIVNTKVLAIAVIDQMDVGEALSLATQYVTAFYMSNYITNVHKGERVLVHAAAGGVGTALVQLLKGKGAIVFAKTGSNEKIPYLKNLDVDTIINYNTQDYEKQISEELKNERLDVVFNPVAGSTFKKDLRLLGAGGRLILFGGSERSGKKWGIFSTLNFIRKMGLLLPIGLMMRSKSVIGVNMLKVADYKPLVLNECLKNVVTLAQSGKIQPKVGAKYTSNELHKAHDHLESGKSVGKVYVVWK